jgi:glutamate N-acetyltransferase / amino-acid N-acetyltransferase
VPLLPHPFQAAGLACGIKPGERLDLGLLVADRAYPAAALFTRNKLLGAHVPVCREHLHATGGQVRAVLVNSGNANCSTGARGQEDNRRVCAALAEALGARSEEILFLSTGVIGAPLPTDTILEALPDLLEAAGPTGLDDFSRAILTTDTGPKLACHFADSARVTGVAKGSGMIHPDMATMLAFLLTDAVLPAQPLGLLKSVNRRSFQRTTVDGDTSPNDTLLLWGSGEVETPELQPVLERTAIGLARAIARDGEGATRLITVRVEGAPDEDAAAQVARTIASSPLTKTAVTGRDPNWGRILAAAGRAGVEFDPERARVWIGSATVYADGTPRVEGEDAAHTHLVEQPEVLLGVDLAAGSAAAEAWTCDLTADYVRINADYRS